MLKTVPLSQLMLRSKNSSDQRISVPAQNKSPRFILKNLFVFFFILLFTLKINAQAPIETSLFGQNAWWVDVNNPVQLDDYWDDIEASGVKYVRIGGIAPNFDPVYTWNPSTYAVSGSDVTNLKHLIDKIREFHMEPMIEVGYSPSALGCTNSGISLSNQALVAANLVDRINHVEYSGNPILYWIIANEPDLWVDGCSGGYGYNSANYPSTPTPASFVATYIKEFATQMKGEDASIKIIGPEAAWYTSGIMNDLTDAGGTYDITGQVPGHTYCYVDILSFHIYSFDGTQTTRSQVISSLGSFQTNIESLKARLATCDSFHNRATSLRIAITEANINWKNPASDDVNGIGANSFIGGQYWAEMIGICMKEGVEFLNFWSVREGGSSVYNIGYLDGSSGNKKPSYYHFEMVSENFSGNYADATDNQSNVKAFACKNSSNIAVMIMNQESSTNFNYTVRLNTSTVSGSNALKINVDASVDKEYSDAINNQTSVVLVFDLAGNILKKGVYTIGSYTSPASWTTYSTGTANDTFIVKNASWKYLDNGSNQGTGWRATSFNDASWSSGNAQLGYGDGDEATTISYGSDPNNKYITTYFRKSFTVSTPSNYTSLILDLVRDDGAVVYLNGTEVYRNNMPTGTITYTTAASSAIINGDESAYYSSTFSSSGLVSGTNVIAVELHQNIGTSSDLSFNFQLRGVRSPCTPPSAPTAGSNSPLCPGSTINLTASSITNATYSWHGPNSFSSSAQNPSITSCTTANAGTYSVTATVGGCTSSAGTVSVTVNGSSPPSVGGNTPVCTGATINLTANTIIGATYSWTGPNSFTSSSQNPSITNCTTANGGTYSVTATVGGCTSSAGTKTITVNSTPSAPTAGSNSPVCQSATINLTSNTVSGATYSWHGPDGWTSAAEDPSRTGAGVTMDGTYSVTVTVNGCTSSAGTTAVTIPNFSSMNPGSSTTFCSGANVILWAAEGTGYSWQWIKDNSNIGGATAHSYQAAVAGDYQVRIYNGTCYAWSAPTTVTVNSSLVAAITPGGPTTFCTGGSVTLFANTCSGYTWQWRKKDGSGVYQDISGATGASYSATQAGWYQVRVTQSGNNAWSAGVEIIVNSCRQANPASVPISETSDFSVYPNPSTGEFTVDIHSVDTTNKIAQIEVLNTLGQLVYAAADLPVSGPSAQETIYFDKEHLNGIYIVRVTLGDKVMYSKVVLSR